MVLFCCFLGLGLVSLILFLTKRKAEVTLGVATLKTVTSLFFIFAALAAASVNDACPRYFALFMAGGAVFGLLGDLTLDLKYVYPNDSGYYLKCGFLSFLLGHVCYSTGLIILYYRSAIDRPLVVFGVAALVCVGTILFTLTTENLLGVRYGGSKPITCVYMAFLGFTLGLSLGLAIATHFSTQTLIMLVGMVLFIGSDAVLSGIYFSLDEKKRTSRPSIIINHTMYYIAQFLIALSILFAKPNL